MALDNRLQSSFSQSMKVSDKQIQRLITCVFDELKGAKLITFKDKEDKVFKKAVQLIQAEYQKEVDLDQAVHKMMDDLERQNPGEFQRYKMFPLLKKRLAKEKGVIL